MYYIIFDNFLNCYVFDKNDERVRCSTLMDCFDYLEYVLKTTDFKRYSFYLRVNCCY